jgi:hypothetical protein
VAEILGLHPAIYLSELMNINDKAIRKDKVNDSSFILDRDYVSKRTTLSVDEQLDVESNLIKLGIVDKPNDDKEKNTMSSAIKLAKKILSRAEIIGIEKIVFDSDIKIAGTIDLLIRAKKDGKIWILDHKTNEKIDTFNKWNTFALKPIENIPNTNYFQYTLQLNLYENILKRVGYVDNGETIDKALFHITESGNKTYPVTGAQKEIELMIQHHLSGV